MRTDCRSEEGITVGLIDALISICRILAKRDLTTPQAGEALLDLRQDEDVLKVFLKTVRYPMLHYDPAHNGYMEESSNDG